MKVIPIQKAASAIVTPDTALLPPPGESLFDRRGRSVRDLRISVTDRCNFRCVYCMPREVFGDDYTFLPRRELLSFEEIVRVASLFVARGVRKIRITGGEPLLRKDVDRLIEMLARLPGVEITLTTNGVLLPKLARRLKDAGLHRVTVSLDVVHVAAHQGQLGGDAGQQQADEEKGKGVHRGSGGEDWKGRRVLKQALHRVICPRVGADRNCDTIAPLIVSHQGARKRRTDYGTGPEDADMAGHGDDRPRTRSRSHHRDCARADQ